MSAHEGSLKARAVSELKAYAVITLYLWLFLGCFMIYRWLVMAESGVTTLHFGFALVEAMIVAKVMLIGGAFAFTRRYDDAPLALAVAYKSALFAVLVGLFAVAEHLVVGWFRGQGLFGGLREFAAVGVYEIGARMLMMTVAFVPFFAVREVGRVIGMQKLAAMFFARPAAAPATGTSPADAGRRPE
jgi:hypothetical protein